MRNEKELKNKIEEMKIAIEDLRTHWILCKNTRTPTVREISEHSVSMGILEGYKQALEWTLVKGE